jgi:hypothetical protein
MTFSYELGRPSLHFVKNHPAKFSGSRFRSTGGRPTTDLPTKMNKIVVTDDQGR